MDFTYPQEAEAFRKEFRAWLDGHLTDDLRRAGAASRRGRPGPDRATEGMEPHARRRPVRGHRLASGVRRAGRVAHGAGRLRRGDAPRRGAGDGEHHRLVEHRAGDHGARHRGAEAGPAPPHAARRRHLVPGLLGARRRVRPGVAVDVGRGRRRRLRDQRAEDLEHARRVRQPVRAARADGPRRAEASGDLVSARRHGARRASRHVRSSRSPANGSSPRSSSPTCASRGMRCSGRRTRAGAWR